RHAFLAPEPEGQMGAVFSPNGDGSLDGTTATFRLSRPLEVGVEVRIGGAGGFAVRHLAAPTTLPAGEHSVTWDGRGDAGQVVADGRYSVVVSFADACG